MRVKFILRLIIVMLLGRCLSGCEKDKLDRQMEALCQLDGGSKLYEKVVLPEKMFDESGYPFPGWRARLNREDRLSKDYLYLDESKTLKAGDPFKGEGQLTKSHIKIIRKSDGKVLGESIEYSRAGGDGLFFVHPSSNYCPRGSGGPIEKLVFVQQ